MIDAEMKKQLSTFFSKIDKDITLVYAQSSHSDQQDLVSMLEGIASAHPQKIRALEGPQKSPAPSFHIEVAGKPNGVHFRGIPGGHEFSSLILAILNSAQLGKLPDTNTIRRIQNIKGPIKIKTYISLTCENCPDVVQALNQMAILHGNFSHEMIDGSYAPEEIEALGIQGVPSVVANGKMIHSGRINFIDLLAKVEKEFGTQGELTLQAQDLGHVDVAVLGGGPAGVSAAIYSARKGLKVALIAERIGGQVQDTKGIENLISVIYTEGPQLAAQMAEHLKSYPVEVLENRRAEKLTTENGKTQILLESKETLLANAVIIATGAKWRELGIPGEKEYLGHGVAFCPHCDGPFYKGKKVAVIGGGNSGVEAAIDLAGIVREVVVFEFQDQLKADQVLVNKLNSLTNVTVITSARTSEIKGDGQKVTKLEYENRKTNTLESVDLDGIFIQIGLLPNTQFLKNTVELTKFGEIVVDNKGRTSTPGIYAAGDVTTTPYKQIIIAMGEGAKASLAAFEDRMKQI